MLETRSSRDLVDNLVASIWQYFYRLPDTAYLVLVKKKFEGAKYTNFVKDQPSPEPTVSCALGSSLNHARYFSITSTSIAPVMNALFFLSLLSFLAARISRRYSNEEHCFSIQHYDLLFVYMLYIERLGPSC